MFTPCICIDFGLTLVDASGNNMWLRNKNLQYNVNRDSIWISGVVSVLVGLEIYHYASFWYLFVVKIFHLDICQYINKNTWSMTWIIFNSNGFLITHYYLDCWNISTCLWTNILSHNLISHLSRPTLKDDLQNLTFIEETSNFTKNSSKLGWDFLFHLIFIYETKYHTKNSLNLA